MTALGDSLTRGWGAGGSAGDFVSASWSTGTDTTVASHFQRLAPLQPGLAASNVAVSGSKMAATSTQADAAVSAGATYVTLLSGTNDVCTSSVALMTSVSDFTAQVRTTLTKLAAISGTKILVASIPNWHALWSDHNTNPTAVSGWAMRNVCPTIFGGDTTDEDRAAARQRITDFNTVLATVCAEFAPCTYDGGATHALRFAPTDLAFDFFHLSVAGQARLAEATWNVGPFTQPPVNQSPPTVSGTAQVGQSLSTSTGTWSGSP
ncbi:MAG: GDSL-type esterase/lipase family protein, partial [Actinomycetota bacterium]|nr:GDSL-type esterase/lipase family protein [Actinomycetota bacterium]